jgi:hypothetical protein
MVDSALLGETAARCMESMDAIEQVDGGAIDAVMIIVVARDEGDTLMHAQVFSSERAAWKQMGLIHTGLEVLTTGERGNHGEADE